MWVLSHLERTPLVRSLPPPQKDPAGKEPSQCMGASQLREMSSSPLHGIRNSWHSRNKVRKELGAVLRRFPSARLVRINPENPGGRLQTCSLSRSIVIVVTWEETPCLLLAFACSSRELTLIIGKKLGKIGFEIHGVIY